MVRKRTKNKWNCIYQGSWSAIGLTMWKNKKTSMTCFCTPRENYSLAHFKNHVKIQIWLWLPWKQNHIFPRCVVHWTEKKVQLNLFNKISCKTKRDAKLSSTRLLPISKMKASYPTGRILSSFCFEVGYWTNLDWQDTTQYCHSVWGSSSH